MRVSDSNDDSNWGRYSSDVVDLAEGHVYYVEAAALLSSQLSRLRIGAEQFTSGNTQQLSFINLPINTHREP